MKIERTLEKNFDKQDLLVGDAIITGEDKTMWKVLDIDQENHKALVWNCTNIEDYVFNKGGSNVYANSDIEGYLQGVFLLTVPQEFRDIVDGDFFLLSEAEVNQYMPDLNNRTAAAKSGNVTEWWTSTPSDGTDYGVRVVNPGGSIGNYGAVSSFGVAPACWITLL